MRRWSAPLRPSTGTSSDGCRRAHGRRGGSLRRTGEPAAREAGRNGTPRNELALTLGMYQYEGAPEAIAQMLSEAPPPVRWVVPKLSRRAFRRHALRIHGTPTP